MSVYVASMNMRGKRAPPPSSEYLKVNTTSAQATASQYRKDFSPMSQTNYKGFFCFENYWQSGKVYDGLDQQKVQEWWRSQTSGKRRLPQGKGRKILYAKFHDRDDKLDYIQSRKQIYLPEYWNLVKDTVSIKKLKNHLLGGESIVLYDFDGPRDNYKEPLCLKASVDIIKEKLNDETFPFGHSYIIASILLGISVDDLIK